MSIAARRRTSSSSGPAESAPSVGAFEDDEHPARMAASAAATRDAELLKCHDRAGVAQQFSM
jgi:hypothetical protein